MTVVLVTRFEEVWNGRGCTHIVVLEISEFVCVRCVKMVCDGGKMIMEKYPF